MRVASVTDFINVEDIDLVFDHLENKYGYAKVWRQDCRDFVAAQAIATPLPQKDPVLAFLAFGSERINPLLNQARCNPFGYAYFSRMVFWLLRNRLTDQGWIRFSEDETF